MWTSGSGFAEQPEEGGKRSFAKRQFVVGIPLFLLISIEYFAQRGIITDASQIPLFVLMKGERYAYSDGIL